MGSRRLPDLRDRMRPRDLDAFVLARRRAGTLREVAERADVSKTFLSELELGDKPYCSRPVARGIAAAIGLPMDELFEPVPRAEREPEIREPKVS